MTRLKIAVASVGFAFLTAFAFLCLWMTLQVFAPRIATFASTVDHLPEVGGVVAIGCGLVYIFKNLLD